MRYGDNRPRIVRRLIYVLIIILAALLQNSCGILFPELPVRALILLPLVVSISMFEREVPAALFGALSGAIWDISSGKDGFNTLVLMLLCAVCSLLISHFMQNNLVTALVLGLSSLVVYEMLYIAVFIIMSGAGNLFKRLLDFYLPSLLITAVFIPLFYYVIKSVHTSHTVSER